MRKTKEVFYSDKKYKISEMPAMQAMNFIEDILRLGASSANADRVKALVSVFFKTGQETDIKEDENSSKDFGAVLIEFVLGIISRCDRNERKQLHSDLLTCISYVQAHELGANTIPLDLSNVDHLVENQIILLKLFWEVLKLNYDFLGNVAGSTVNSLRDQITKQ